jgi:predicted kinase
MKSLSLSRPLIIMMVGYPGAGKSFFATQFAETFNAPLVSVDKLRTDIFTNPTYSKEEDQLIERITSYQVDQLIRTNKSLIVDGGVNSRVNRQAIEKVARAKGYGTLIIWVQTDGPTCRSRALKRSPTRPGDVNNTSMDESAFVQQVKRLTPPSAMEQSLVISGKHTYATQLRVVLKKLVPPRDDVVEPQTYSHTPQQRPYGDIPPKPRRLTIN